MHEFYWTLDDLATKAYTRELRHGDGYWRGVEEVLDVVYENPFALHSQRCRILSAFGDEAYRVLRRLQKQLLTAV